MLRATFLGTAEDRAGSVRVWGFRGPLGAWVTIWGALAMLTSAPFDNWWHDAYGLVPLREVPHIVREVIDIVRGVPHIVRGVIDIVREVPRMLRRAAIIDRGASWAVRRAVTTRAEAAIPSRAAMIFVREVPYLGKRHAPKLRQERNICRTRLLENESSPGGATSWRVLAVLCVRPDAAPDGA